LVVLRYVNSIPLKEEVTRAGVEVGRKEETQQTKKVDKEAEDLVKEAVKEENKKNKGKEEMDETVKHFDASSVEERTDGSSNDAASYSNNDVVISNNDVVVALEDVKVPELTLSWKRNNAVASEVRALKWISNLNDRLASLPMFAKPPKKQLEISVKKLFSVAALGSEKTEKKDKKVRSNTNKKKTLFCKQIFFLRTRRLTRRKSDFRS
jgi:hypothetical protein